MHKFDKDSWRQIDHACVFNKKITHFNNNNINTTATTAAAAVTDNNDGDDSDNDHHNNKNNNTAYIYTFLCLAVPSPWKFNPVQFFFLNSSPDLAKIHRPRPTSRKGSYCASSLRSPRLLHRRTSDHRSSSANRLEDHELGDRMVNESQRSTHSLWLADQIWANWTLTLIYVPQKEAVAVRESWKAQRENLKPRHSHSNPWRTEYG